MKTTVLLLLLLNSIAFAGDKGLNGGDMCEKRVKEIRDDIKSWIIEGGADYLTLPAHITLAEYKSRMLSEIHEAGIQCVEKTLVVHGAEKTCKNYVDSNGKREIVCNIRRFNDETSESDQYVLVHHEYAGLSRFEVNEGASSNYTLSDQITGFLEDVEVKKLSIHPTREYETSTGAKFKRVRFGKSGLGWRDPSGLVWSAYLDNAEMFDFATAIQKCERIGARLPTTKEYLNLASYFEREHDNGQDGNFMEAGRSDFYNIFPDVRVEGDPNPVDPSSSMWGWTSTMYDSAKHYIFVPAGGFVGEENNTEQYSVRCVNRAD